jgi:hypothetical protein
VSNTIRIKRSTATAAPTTLANAELAFSENSEKLFIGVGTGGAGGSATSIVAIGGPGAYATLDTAQTISGAKTFTGSVALGSATITGLSSTSVSEGANLYYTDARARGAISVDTATGLTYNSTTGVVALARNPQQRPCQQQHHNQRHRHPAGRHRNHDRRQYINRRHPHPFGHCGRSRSWHQRQHLHIRTT